MNRNPMLPAVNPLAEADPYASGLDLLVYTLRKTGEVLPQTGTTDPADQVRIDAADHLIDAKRYIDQAQLDIVGMRPWSWARASTQILAPPMAAVQVTQIQGTQVTLKTAPPATASYSWFQMDSEPTQYQIQSGTGTVWSLAVPYIGARTTGSASLWQSIQVMPAVYLGFPWIYDTDAGHWVPLRPLTDQGMTIRRGGGPREVRFFRKDGLLLLPPSRSPRTFLITYNQHPAPLSFDGVAATDTPMIPPQFRVILGDRAAERLYADKRDSRSQQVGAEVRDTLSRMVAQEVAASRPRMWIPAGHRVSG